MRFADKLKGLRADRGLSQNDLAERSGVPVTTIRNFEQGRRFPSWPVLQRLVKALAASLGDFDGLEPADERTAKRKSVRRR